MRKIKLLTIALLALFLLCSCSSVRCDICDKRGADHVVEAVTSWNLCDDCYYELDLDYDYDFDDYDFDDYEFDDYDSYGGRCNDCGTSISSDRYYCDSCLGYGTCQDCGKDIDSDRFYCDTCLGYGTCQDCGKDIASDRFYCNSCLYD